jgi:hypothetical protein
METLFPTSSPTEKPSSSDSLNNHPDTQRGAIISFTVLGSAILMLILIFSFFCRKNVRATKIPVKIENV